MSGGQWYLFTGLTLSVFMFIKALVSRAAKEIPFVPFVIGAVSSGLAVIFLWPLVIPVVWCFQDKEL